jgi:hypothetical protein
VDDLLPRVAVRDVLRIGLNVVMGWYRAFVPFKLQR